MPQVALAIFPVAEHAPVVRVGPGPVVRAAISCAQWERVLSVPMQAGIGRPGAAGRAAMAQYNARIAIAMNVPDIAPYAVANRRAIAAIAVLRRILLRSWSDSPRQPEFGE